MAALSSDYYEDINGKLRGVLFQTADTLQPDAVKFLTEMLDANELGLALEMMVEALEEANTPITPDISSTLEALARKMKMDYNVQGALQGLVSE